MSTRNSPAGSGLLAVGGALLVGLAAAAVLAPWIAPYDPLASVGVVGEPTAPSTQFLLGTDALGRDVLSRLLFGARLSLGIGIAAMSLSVTIGLTIGLAAGALGGVVDAALMRFTDLVIALPGLLIAIALAAVLEPGVANLLIVIGIVSWTGVARVVRGEVVSLAERDFYLAARALGAGPARRAWQHLLPGVLPTVITLAALSASGTLLLEAGLSFLGLGLPPPAPSFGRMVSDGSSYYQIAPWLIVSPGLAILLTVLACNLVAQGLLARSERRT